MRCGGKPKYQMHTNELFNKSSKTLLVKRRLLNAEALRSWARQQGFTSTLAADDMHVTVVYSNEPFPWEDHFEPQDNKLIIRDGDRKLEQFGDATVLCFGSELLHARWQEFEDGGASYGFPKYRPHVTISYDGIDVQSAEPYEGELIFGPENFSEIEDDWSDDLEEIAL
jgi:hypothetical protein